MHRDEKSPLESLIDRLQIDQHLEMMRLLAAHPQDGTAWEDAYKQCIVLQGVVGGGLTLRVTEKFATETMNLRAQPLYGGAQNHDALSQTTGKPSDKEVLRGYVESMVEEKVAGQRKQTQRKTRPPHGGQGAGAATSGGGRTKLAATTASLLLSAAWLSSPMCSEIFDISHPCTFSCRIIV